MKKTLFQNYVAMLHDQRVILQHPNPTFVDPLRQVGSTFEAAKHAVGLDVCRRWQLWTTTKNPKQIEQ